MPRVTVDLPSNPPDPRVLQILAVVNTLCLTIVAAISIVSLATWVTPPLANALPASWSQRTFGIALCSLLAALSLALSMPRRSTRQIDTSRILALAVVFLSSLTLLRTLITTHPELYHDPATQQAATAFLALGVLMLAARVRRPGWTKCVDAFTLAVCVLMLVFLYGYALNAMHMLNASTQTRIPFQTTACLILLTFVAFNRRAEHGIFSILYGAGIGGKTARFAAPFALALPIIRSVGRSYIHTEYVTAIASLTAFCFVLFLSLRIDKLEKNVRDLSLRDELTGLYNRRGFYLLAEQAHRLARRAHEPFSIVFLDLDNLKHINDLQGHEAGSALLRQMASLLGHNFRETDILGRLGGDEFVVAAPGSGLEINRAILRLEATAARTRPAGYSASSLNFSLGSVTADADSPLTLEDMIQRADQIMYETKRLKKSQPPQPTTPATLVDQSLATSDHQLTTIH